tara:strand:+ start:41 stop:739 length:699 start_codon:yes stop_codon:yes gene_type:complete
MNEEIICINNNVTEIIPIFKHNFCESRLQNNEGPEVYNACSALVITIIPIITGFPVYPQFYNVAMMLAVNGIASSHYHYYLSWSGKQADEISMILANYFGLWGLINMYYNKTQERNQLNKYNTIFMYLFLTINTLIEYDKLFPSIFGSYVGFSVIMINKVANKYNAPYKRYLLVSFLGFVCWMISEYDCNESTVHGHTIWHILFPLGFYRLLQRYDNIKLKPEIKSHDKNFR